jgi:hypothetical protein
MMCRVYALGRCGCRHASPLSGRTSCDVSIPFANIEKQKDRERERERKAFDYSDCGVRGFTKGATLKPLGPELPRAISLCIYGMDVNPRFTICCTNVAYLLFHEFGPPCQSTQCKGEAHGMVNRCTRLRGKPQSDNYMYMFTARAPLASVFRRQIPRSAEEGWAALVH